MRERSLVWLFPGQPHVLISHSRDFEMWIGVFRPGLVREVGKDGALGPLTKRNPPGHFCRRIDAGWYDRLDQLFGRLDDAEMDTARRNVGLAWALHETWTAFNAAPAAAAPGESEWHPAVRKAIALLREDPAPWTIHTLAEQCGVSSAWLSHLIQRQTGLTLTVLRNRLRLERFQRLARDHPRRHLIDLALDAGFRSYSQFYRVCMAMAGATPAALAGRGAAGDA
jgi:AraC-like DNA-binding protein